MQPQTFVPIVPYGVRLANHNETLVPVVRQGLPINHNETVVCACVVAAHGARARAAATA